MNIYLLNHLSCLRVLGTQMKWAAGLSSWTQCPEWSGVLWGGAEGPSSHSSLFRGRVCSWGNCTCGGPSPELAGCSLGVYITPLWVSWGVNRLLTCLTPHWFGIEISSATCSVCNETAWVNPSIKIFFFFKLLCTTNLSDTEYSVRPGKKRWGHSR